MTGYYEETSAGGDQARRSGWRRPIGQRLRFEMALQWWAWTEIGSVVDLGCGTAMLATYMRRSGRSARYVGIDVRAESVHDAADLESEDRVFVGDIYDENLIDAPADLAVAIGAQVDGRERRSARDRIAGVRRLVRRASEVGAKGAIVIVLDQEAVESRASLALEPALFGVTRPELEGIAGGLNRENFVVDGFLQTDLALVVHDGGPAFDGVETDPAHERVVASHRRRGGSELDVVWLWLEAGRLERAEALLERLPAEGRDPEEYRLLCDRLEQMRSE